MNTEALNTLKQVRAAAKNVTLQLTDNSLKKDERNLLEATLIQLNDIDDTIVNEVLQNMIDKINSSNTQLKQLIIKMKASSDKIAQFSKTIKAVSDTVGLLASLMKMAIAGGILGV